MFLWFLVGLLIVDVFVGVLVVVLLWCFGVCIVVDGFGLFVVF